MNAAVAAIHFALEDDDGMDFLRYWNEGQFDVLRRNWEDIPEDVFIGADPLHPKTVIPRDPEVMRPISTAPRDGTNVLIFFGQDGVSQGKYIPGIPHPWQFIDTNNGISWLINHAVDGPGGPTHWLPMPEFRSTAQ